MRERRHSGGEEIMPLELVGIEDVEGADDIRHEALRWLEIPDIVAQEGFVRSLDLTGLQGTISIKKLSGL